jgi:hypothetical protein
VRAALSAGAYAAEGFLDDDGFERFVAAIREAEPEALFLTGDIAMANTVETLLQRVRAAIAVPVLFVLGNHDFYRGSVTEVRARRSLLERLADHDAERLEATLRSVVDGAERVVVRTRRRSPRCFSGRGTRRAPRCQLRG